MKWVAPLDLIELVNEKQVNILVSQKVIVKLKMGERCLLGRECDS